MQCFEKPGWAGGPVQDALARPFKLLPLQQTKQPRYDHVLPQTELHRLSDSIKSFDLSRPLHLMFLHLARAEFGLAFRLQDVNDFAAAKPNAHLSIPRIGAWRSHAERMQGGVRARIGVGSVGGLKGPRGRL